MGCPRVLAPLWFLYGFLKRSKVGAHYKQIVTTTVKKFDSDQSQALKDEFNTWKEDLNPAQNAVLDNLDSLAIELKRYQEMASDNSKNTEAYQLAGAALSSGLDSLVAASRQAKANGNSEEFKVHQENASALVQAGKHLLDFTLGFVPGVSTGKDLYEAFTGKSLVFQGQQLSAVERSISFVAVAASIVPGGSNGAKIAFRALHKLIAGAGKRIKGFATEGIPGIIRTSERIVDSAGRNWTSVKGLLHTVKGNAKLAADGTFKLKSGMHTEKGLEHFVRLNTGKGKNYTVQAVTTFSEKNMTSGVILKETLPNGVTRLQLPRDAWHNSDAFKSAAIEIVPGQKIKGIKTLWPSNFSISDIAEATETIFQAGKTGAPRERVFGTFRNLKVTVNVDGGKVVSSFPDWIQ